MKKIPGSSVVDIHTGRPVIEGTRTGAGSRLKLTRQERHMEQKELAERIGVSAKAVSSWEVGRTSPDSALIPRICEALGVDLYEYYGIPDPRIPYSIREKELILQYRELNPQNRKLADRMLESMLELQAMDDIPELIALPYFDKALSAGIGDPTEFAGLSEPMYLYDSDEFRRADYIFRINGDSMEPDFRSGDLVLVERVPSGDRIAVGEIGAFIVGNEMYIKEYRPDGLHSLNPAYDTLHFDEEQTVYLIGKVLSVLDPEQIATADDVEKFRMVHE